MTRPGDGSLSVAWSTAGHPPPLLVRPDGTVEVVQLEPDVMVGIDRRIPRTDLSTTVPPGGRVLLFTDGLVERRDEPIDTGIARLVQVVGDCHAQGVAGEDLAEAVIDAMVGVAAEDDIAVLVVENPA